MSGVKLNFDPTSLSNAWSLCYNGTYDVAMNSSLVIYILSICNKAQLMLGCRSVGNSLLAVAAMGLRANVLHNCNSIQSCTCVANGVGWYYSDSYSWGFVNNTDSVIRDSCDTGTTNSDYRLCWHTGEAYGGYRCGSIVSGNNNYERVIYHAN
jgi:hypothetical protein